MSDQYLELLKRVLTGAVFPESADRIMQLEPNSSLRLRARNFLVKAAAKYGLRLVRVGQYDHAAREEGRDWPSIGYTMVGLKRLDNVQHAIERAGSATHCPAPPSKRLPSCERMGTSTSPPWISCRTSTTKFLPVAS
jgi:Macrocin-O-methyltransferase (TylF)